VIYNPSAGRGRVGRRMEAMRARLPAKSELLATRGPGDAASLAEAAVRAGARWVIAAGGDGTVHEVANGILAADEVDVTFMPLPLGSMNDYAFTLGILDWWSARRGWHELRTMPVDVGIIRSGPRRKWFVNGCGVGFNGMVTIEALKIRWLRGVPLYALAVLMALLKHYRTPSLAIRNGEHSIEQPTLACTIGLAQREGGFPLTALARLDDGCFDTLRVGDIRRWELIRHLPGMISGWLPRSHPKLQFGHAQRIEIESSSPLCVHIDGEFFCVPADAVKRIYIDILPRRLRVAYDPPFLYGGQRFDSLRQECDGPVGSAANS
jgi:diacylglycerol kinase family enzyme